MRLRTIFAVALLASLTACSSLHRVSADEFVRLVSKPAESMFLSGYVGYSRGLQEQSNIRVYLFVSRMGLFGALLGIHSWSTELYWTPLSEFRGDLATQILAGHDPWSDSGQGLSN